MASSPKRARSPSPSPSLHDRDAEEEEEEEEPQPAAKRARVERFCALVVAFENHTRTTPVMIVRGDAAGHATFEELLLEGKEGDNHIGYPATWECLNIIAKFEPVCNDQGPVDDDSSFEAKLATFVISNHITCELSTGDAVAPCLSEGGHVHVYCVANHF